MTMKKQAVEDFALFGGPPVFDSFRTTMNLVVPDREVFFHYAKISFMENQLTNNGPSVLKLEKQLADFHEVRHCISFCNCFTGMFLALRVMSLPGRNEVVVPSLTYRRMADIIDWAGLLPCFCDVDSETLGISPETTRVCINESTALILAPHPITKLCDIEGMEALAREYGLPLLFDSVEACGATHKGRKIGGFGDCESFSMHSSKLLNSCEGGYITTNNGLLADKLRKVRAFGFSRLDHIEMLGYNAKLNELHAAMGLATLSSLHVQILENKRLHLAYQQGLANLPGLTVISYDVNEQCNWKSLLVHLDAEWPFDRNTTLDLLNAENIHAREYYSPAQHTTFPRQAVAGKNFMPVTTRAATNHLLLPFGSTVSVKDTEIIGQVLRMAYAHRDAIRAQLQKKKQP